MSVINIAGERHVIKRAGLTLCGQAYPARWQTAGGSATCPVCCRMVKAKRLEIEASLRAEQQARIATAGEDIPF